MPTYSIKAPDGNTYDIDGPEGASEEQVRSRVLAAHPEAGQSAQMAQLNAIQPRAGQAQAATDVWKRELKDEGGTGNLVQNTAAGIGKMMTDQGLAARQAAAYFGAGDADALAKEAAAKKALDAPLTSTVGGKVGEVGANVLEGAVPFGALTRFAKMIPRFPGAGMVRGMLPAATVGAAQEVASPDEAYSPGWQAAKGAGFGVGGDVAGRTVGRALSPMQTTVSDTVKQYVERLRSAFPDSKQLAETISDSGAVKALTNALAQIPGFGSSVKAARAGNLGDYTEAATKQAGYPTRELSEDAARNLHGQLDDTYAFMRRAPPLPANGMAPALAAARNASDLESRLIGTTRPARQLSIAEGAVQPTAPALPPHVQSLLHAAGIPLPPQFFVTPKVPVGTALDVRSELGDQVFRTEAGISSKGAETIRDQLDDMLTKRFGSLYPETQQQYGRSKDIAAVQNTQGGVTPEGHIRPETFLKQLPEREVANPTSAFTQATKAAAQRWNTPSLSENRSLMVRLLTGGALTGLAGGGSLLAGGAGAAVGAGAGLGTLALARALLGTEGGGRYLTGQNASTLGKQLQSPQMREFLRLLGASTANEETP